MGEKIVSVNSQVLPEELFCGELEIGGKLRPIAVNLNTIVDMEDAAGSRIQVFSTGQAGTREIRALVWAALKEGSRIKNTSKRVSPELTTERNGLTLVGSWMSTNNMHEMLQKVLELLKKFRQSSSDERYLAPYVPTPNEVIKKGLELAGLTDGQAFIDLGCGQGHSLELAVREFGATSVVGYELDDDRFMIAKARVICLKEELPFQGVVVQDDLRTADLSKIDVAFVYLLQASNQLLKEWLASGLKTGAKLISHDFTMDGWTPVAQWKDTVDNRPHELYVYEIGNNTPVDKAA